ncbi:MAG: hypothetical protein Q8P30_02505 [Candidatus Uhrbacteria bacterium]|nr:hypothetical protein [Candidatus Uhrbacteria bacterium]
MRLTALFLFASACAAPKFGEDMEEGIATGLPTSDALTFEFTPDSEFVVATASYTTSEMDEWSESVTWDAVIDGGDGLGFTLYNAPDAGWVAVHGWAEAPALYDPKQVCTLGEGIEYPAGEATFSVAKSELHWGYSAHQEGVDGSCYLVFDWYVGDGERVDLPWNPFY